MIEIYRFFSRFLKRLYGRIGLGLMLMILSAVFSGISIAMLYPVFDKVFSVVPDPAQPLELYGALGDAVRQIVQEAVLWLQGPGSLATVAAVTADEIGRSFDQAAKLQVLHFLIWAILGLIALKTTTRYFYKITFLSIELELVRRIRNSLFDHLLGLSLSFYSRYKSGDLLSRMISDVAKVRRMIIFNVAELLFNAAQVAVLLTMAFIIDLQLTLFSLVMFPLFGFIFQKITSKMKKYAGRNQARIADVTSSLAEAFHAIRIIIGYNSRDWENKRFANRTQRYKRSDWKLTRVDAGIAPLSELLSSGVTVFVLWLGGTRIISPESQLSPAAFMVFLGALLSLLRPVKLIGNLWGEIQKGAASANRILEIYNIRPEISCPAEPQSLQPLQDGITFVNVDFSYGEENVLHKINLKLQKGCTVALVGSSGGGKSTLLQLLARYYDPVAGSIEWDGIGLTEVDPADLRSRLGIVTQDVIMVDDTVFNNIAYGVENADPEAVEAAATAAQAWEFISDLPDGVQTHVGEKGFRLSGGQKQRLAIARALFRNPELLLLDEATSALDTESEKLVQIAIDRLIEDRTAVVVAHRLSTIRKADEIIVIENGTILEQGSHEELLARNTRYAELCRLQQF
jgi:ATP-binding cassette, subfamily B, bacterial MsbA